MTVIIRLKVNKTIVFQLYMIRGLFLMKANVWCNVGMDCIGGLQRLFWRLICVKVNNNFNSKLHVTLTTQWSKDRTCLPSRNCLIFVDLESMANRSYETKCDN